MKEEIKSIFQNVNDWLKFAEAKHAGLLVLNSGIIFGILTVYKDYQNYLPKAILFITILFFVLSILTSIISLFPRTHTSLFRQKKFNNPNLYFAGHLCKLDENDLKTELTEIHSTYVFDKFDEDVLKQIIVNSKIATKKYHLFKFAIIATIIGFIIPAFTILLKIISIY